MICPMAKSQRRISKNPKQAARVFWPRETKMIRMVESVTTVNSARKIPSGSQFPKTEPISTFQIPQPKWMSGRFNNPMGLQEQDLLERRLFKWQNGPKGFAKVPYSTSPGQGKPGNTEAIGGNTHPKHPLKTLFTGLVTKCLLGQ